MTQSAAAFAAISRQLLASLPSAKFARKNPVKVSPAAVVSTGVTFRDGLVGSFSASKPAVAETVESFARPDEMLHPVHMVNVQRSKIKNFHFMHNHSSFKIIPTPRASLGAAG